MSPWTAHDIPDQAGRTALVTGASAGLGLEVSVALTGAGARVLMACRDPERGEAALAVVRARTPGADAELVLLDLASLSSIRAAVVELEQSGQVVDVLVNNAGVMATPSSRTADGFELQIGTNHLGHFALTGLLLAGSMSAVAPRVVTVSSVLHRRGKIDLDDLIWERRRYRPWVAYAQSKLANLLFTLELARRSEVAGSPLVAAAAHPGLAATDLTKHVMGANLPIVRSVVAAATRGVAQSAQLGALPLLYAATMPDVLNGDYFGPDGPQEQRGFPTRVGRTPAAADAATAAALWDRSEQLTGVRFPL